MKFIEFVIITIPMFVVAELRSVSENTKNFVTSISGNWILKK